MTGGQVPEDFVTWMTRKREEGLGMESSAGLRRRGVGQWMQGAGWVQAAHQCEDEWL